MIYGLLLIAPINPWKSMLTIQIPIIALDYIEFLSFYCEQRKFPVHSISSWNNSIKQEKSKKLMKIDTCNFLNDWFSSIFNTNWLIISRAP